MGLHLMPIPPPFALGPFLTGALIGLGIIAAVETWGWLRR